MLCCARRAGGIARAWGPERHASGLASGLTRGQGRDGVDARVDANGNGVLERWALRSDASGALLGPMASGKSTLLRGLRRRLASSSLSPSSSPALALDVVSFESSMDFVARFGGESVASVCGGVRSARTRALLVQFGLLDAWTKRVDALSSGELRKLTLARAVLGSPDLLLLDGAHDGLDPWSRRKLSLLLSYLVRGLPRLLVSLGGSGDVPEREQARILQVAQRSDELVREVSDVFVAPKLQERQVSPSLPESQRRVMFDTIVADAASRTTPDPGDASASSERALVVRAALAELSGPDSPFASDPVSDPVSAAAATPLVHLKNATVSFGEADAEQEQSGILGLDWTVRAGECWAVCGGNGAGKSTLAKLVGTPGRLRNEQTLAQLALGLPGAVALGRCNEEDLELLGGARGSGDNAEKVRREVGVVSMDSHMRTLFFARAHDSEGRRRGPLLAGDVVRSGLYGGGVFGVASTDVMARMLGPEGDVGGDRSNAAAAAAAEGAAEGAADGGAAALVMAAAALAGVPAGLLLRPFARMSLGEQRLVLVARALVRRPRLLVLDEAWQGLDAARRVNLSRLVGEVVESGMAVVLITHHLDEVPLASVTHLLHMHKGRARFNGPVRDEAQVSDCFESSFL